MTDQSPNPRRFSFFSKSLAKSLEPIVKPVYKKHGFAEHRILTEWQAIVGKELAACSVPQKLSFQGNKKEGGTLQVLAASARALELQQLQPVILDKIATYFGYPAVSRLAFMQTSGALFRKKEAGTSSKSKHPADAPAVECDDPQLRAALSSLGAALSAVEK